MYYSEYLAIICMISILQCINFILSKFFKSAYIELQKLFKELSSAVKVFLSVTNFLKISTASSILAWTDALFEEPLSFEVVDLERGRFATGD